MVGELKTSGMKKEYDVNIYTYKKYLLQTNYVIEETPVLIETMKNFTNSTSVVKKFDFLAIPDMEADGMGNWGLNTFRYAGTSTRSILFNFNKIIFM